MERITPKQVKDALSATGLLPTKGDYACVDDDGALCACALTALALKRGDITRAHVIGWTTDHSKAAKEAPDIIMGGIANTRDDYEYLSDFMRGFDGEWVRYKSLGYLDGVACAKELFAETEE